MVVDSQETESITPSGFNRHELVRLMVQSLQSLGYKKAAQELETESGYQLESPAVTRFRDCVLNGNWEELEQLAGKLELDPAHEISVRLFLIREQKFLELLEARQIKNALIVLRSELTPLNHNMERVHTLTSYMMSTSAEDLRQRAGWDGSNGTSRLALLSSLQKYISPAVMVPENRLETMLKQAIELQIANCLYHDNRNMSCTLYSDHVCEKTGIPTVTRRVLEGHVNEVWHISFSHNGRFLASASADRRIIIWNLETFEPVQTLQSHTDKVSCCVWSQDDTQLLTAGSDRAVKLWDVQTGTLKSTFQRHTDTIISVGWLPDGDRFVSGSEKDLLLMSTSGDVLHSWQYPVQDLAISEDGKILVVMCGIIIRVINLVDMTEIRKLDESDGIMAISLSKDGQYLLVNTTPKIHLWSLTEGRIVRKYSGFKQGLFVIRSCFGGWNERFVVSGGEDAKVYIWHRENGNLIQTLEGHSRPVTVVAWSPTNPNMFASASDDHTIRM
ncbi:MAG: WD40-repeat-containing domain protein [Benniella sp.]|nr:MAG: WD40-repeat-containing domain protein [Benniella sp.]